VPSALTPFDGFDLQPLTPADLPLLTRRHAHPQVYRWWEGRPLSEAEVREEYLDDDAPVTCCLVYHRGRPVGHLQFFRYEVAAGREAVGLAEGEDAWGIDLFLTDEADRNRRLGTGLLASPLARLAQEGAATLVLTDPHIDNPRAIACYQKAGFRPVRTLPTHEAQAGEWKDALAIAWQPAPAAVLPKPGGKGRLGVA
jgi:aminoglycoside 6'-N-acetyltransferase